MSNLACLFLSWPLLLFIYGIMLAFVSLIVGGIAWMFSWISGVPSWKVLCTEAIVSAFMAMIFWPFGYQGEGIASLCLSGAGASLLLLAVNWLSRRFGSVAESSEAFKPYSFNLGDDSPVSSSFTK